jgi:hypothetical protein
MSAPFTPLDQLPIGESTVEALTVTSQLIVAVPPTLHVESKRIIQAFAEELARKMRDAEAKHGFSDDWLRDLWEVECRRQMQAHLIKGDPRDVAIYCAFMWARGWPTTEPGQ